MEPFKKALKVRIGIILFSWIFILACVITAALISTGPNSTDFSDFHLGFQVGLTAVIEVFLICLSVKYILALRKDEGLKKLYYQENDERTRVINGKTGGNVIYVCAVIILTVGIVAGYFNAVVFLTLVGCSFFLLVTNLVLNLYYSKKF